MTNLKANKRFRKRPEEGEKVKILSRELKFGEVVGLVEKEIKGDIWEVVQLKEIEPIEEYRLIDWFLDLQRVEFV